MNRADVRSAAVRSKRHKQPTVDSGIGDDSRSRPVELDIERGCAAKSPLHVGPRLNEGSMPWRN